MRSFIFFVVLCFISLNGLAQSFSNNHSKFYARYQSINFIPFQLIGNLRDEVDVAVGLRYERSLVDNEISLTVPLTRSLVNNMTYFSPGLKVFLRNKKNVRFYMMPQIYTALGNGEWPSYELINGIQVTKYVDGLRYKIGFLMNVGTDFNISSRWQLGVEYGLGLTYFDKYPPIRNPWDEPRKVTSLFQLNCGLGYKF